MRWDVELEIIIQTDGSKMTSWVQIEWRYEFEFIADAAGDNIGQWLQLNKIYSVKTAIKHD